MASRHPVGSDRPDDSDGEAGAERPDIPVAEAEAGEAPEFYLDLAERLREAHRRANALPEGVRIPVIRRLLTVTEAVKRDPVRASERLDRMLEELAAQGDDPPTR